LKKNSALRTALTAAVFLTFVHACGGDSDTPTPTLNIGVSPSSVAAGQTAMLTWSSTNASSCEAGGAWMGSRSTSGTLQVSQANPGSYTYTLTCSSAASTAAIESVTLTVAPAVLAISGTLPNGVVGVPFAQSIQATGGVAPFAWAVSSGALPAGLSLAPSTTNTVTLSGTPGAAMQAVTFAIQVTDAAHQTASQSFTISILLQADTLTLSPTGLNFPNQIVGTSSAALTETLTNTSSSSVLINAISIATGQAGEFAQSGTTCGSSLSAGASCTINVVFTPSQPGPGDAVLTIVDDTAGSPQSVGLSGVGLSNGPNATLSALNLPFGIEEVGTTSPPLTVSLTNYGSAALNIGNVSTTTNFAESNTCVPSLAVGATCTISVTFTPSGAGDFTGSLSISDDAANSPQTLTLTGTGSTSTPTLTGSCIADCLTFASAQCPAGAPARHPIQIAVCPVGPERGESVGVDGGRSCYRGGTTRAGQGFCATN
jgi:hypothetical protein